MIVLECSPVRKIELTVIKEKGEISYSNSFFFSDLYREIKNIVSLFPEEKEIRLFGNKIYCQNMKIKIEKMFENISVLMEE